MIRADLDGVIDYKNDKILKDAGDIRVVFKGVSFDLTETKHLIENATADILVKEEKIIINKLSLKSGKNDIELRGDISNLIYELSGHHRPIEASFEMNSGRLDMSELLSFDTTLAKKFNEIINDLSLDVKINTTTTDLKDLKSFPEGELVIKSLSTDFQTLPDIEDISGIISTSELLTQDPVSGQMFSEEKIEVKNLKIVSNKSDLEISGNIITKHYPGSDEKSPAMLELKIKSNKLFPKELLQFDSVLAKTYEDEVSKLELDIAYDTYLEDIEKKMVFACWNNNTQIIIS